MVEPISSPNLLSVTLPDYEHLITKKLDEDDNVADFVTPTTEFRVEAYTDANVLSLVKGDVIQSQ